MDKRKGNFELDKICRACLTERKGMRPLFVEMVSNMLMDCTQIEIHNTVGWPDKICVQCVRLVSRFHSFKMSVEKSDRELREYIKGLTVVSEPSIVHVKPITKTVAKQPSNYSLGQSEPKDKEHHTQASKIVLSDGQVITNEQIIGYPLSHIIQTNNGAPQVIGTGREILRAPQIVPLHVQSADFIHGEDFIKEETDFTDQQDVEFIDLNNEEKSHDCNIDDSTDFHIYSIEKIDDECDHVDDTIQHVAKVPDYNIDTIQKNNCKEQTSILQDSKNELNADQEDNNAEEYGTVDDVIKEIVKSKISFLGPGRFKCYLCQQQFQQKKCLEIHMKSHSNWIKANCKMLAQCDFCFSAFKNFEILRLHMRSHQVEQLLHSSENDRACNGCQKPFKAYNPLVQHKH